MRIRLLAVAALVSAASVLSFSSSSLAAVQVACTGGRQLSAAISKALTTAKPGATLEFQVTGNCVDRIEAPLGVRVFIWGSGTGALGGYGASLTAASAAGPALEVSGGWLSIGNFLIRAQTASTAPNAAEVNSGGFLRIANSKVISYTADNAVGTYASGLALINSAVVGSRNSAVEVAANGWAWIYAENGRTTNISYNGTEGGQAIGCWNASLGGGTSGSGMLTVGPSTAQGISARGCRATLGIGSTKGSVRIQQASDVGIRAKAGDMFNLVNVSVANNPRLGIEVSAGVVEFDNSTISKPSAVAVGLSARRGGVIYFNNIYGASSLSWSGTNTNFFNCRQDGRIYGAPDNPAGGAATSGCLVTSDAVTK